MSRGGDRLEFILNQGRALSEVIDGPRQPFRIELTKGPISQFLPETANRRFARTWRVVYWEPFDGARVGETVFGPEGLYHGLPFWRAAGLCQALCDGFRAGRRHMAAELNLIPSGP